MFRVPSIHLTAKTVDVMFEMATEFFRNSSADFLKNFRKDVDEAIGKVLVGSLSSTESSLKFTLCDWLGPPIKIQKTTSASADVEYSSSWITRFITLFGEFDPGSEWTLAAWLRHASRTVFIEGQPDMKAVANGCVTREQSTSKWGIARRKAN